VAHPEEPLFQRLKGYAALKFYTQYWQCMVLVFLEILQYYIEKTCYIGIMSPDHNIPTKQIYL